MFDDSYAKILKCDNNECLKFITHLDNLQSNQLNVLHNISITLQITSINLTEPEDLTLVGILTYIFT